MKLHDVINSVYNKSWTRVNNFSVELSFSDYMFQQSVGWDVTNEDFILSIKSIDTPQYSNNSIEYFTGNEWRFNNGRDEMFRFTMTFRDYDQMKLYKNFTSMYNKSKDNYFDRIKINIVVYLDSEDGVSRTILLQASDSILEGISQLQFSHETENQIAEFSTTFKCSSPVIPGGISSFGAKTSLGASLMSYATNLISK